MSDWILFLCLCLVTGSISAAEYIYNDFDFEELPQRLIIDEVEGTGSIGAFDKHFGGYVCKIDEDFLCFVSWSWQFAIPKDYKPSKISSWSYDEREYKLEKSGHKIIVFGEELVVDVISSKYNFLDEAKGTYFFYYSQDRGIIGFGNRAQGSNSSRYFLLQGRCGFGAKATCK